MKRKEFINLCFLENKVISIKLLQRRLKEKNLLAFFKKEKTLNGFTYFKISNRSIDINYLIIGEGFLATYDLFKGKNFTSKFEIIYASKKIKNNIYKFFKEDSDDLEIKEVFNKVMNKRVEYYAKNSICMKIGLLSGVISGTKLNQDQIQLPQIRQHIKRAFKYYNVRESFEIEEFDKFFTLFLLYNADFIFKNISFNTVEDFNFLKSKIIELSRDFLLEWTLMKNKGFISYNDLNKKDYYERF